MHLLELHFYKPDSFILPLGQEYAIEAKGFFLDFYRGELIQSFLLLWGTVATFGKPICKRRRIN